MLLISLAFAQELGTIRFVIGTVEYQKHQNQAFKPVLKDMPVQLEWNIKTALAASAEILWNDGSVTVVEQNQNLSIRDLYEDATAKASWRNKLKRKIGNLRLTKDSESSTVAGIRRSEAEAEEKADLYWGFEELVDLGVAIAKYEEEKHEEAIPLLLKVIEQDPLQKDAEISHVVLILIYDQLGNISDRDRQVEILKTDFPSSQFLKDLPQP
jgi:hypothetical protein